MPEPLSGEQVIAAIREQTDTILMAFSCGKDSIGAWLACRPHFRRIVPFHMYLVPGLKFVERSLRYYEEFFGTPIIRVPHPSLYRMLNQFVFQAPQNCAVIEAANLADFEYHEIYTQIRAREGLSNTAYAASGVRAVDSPYRLVAIKRYGPINHKKRHFYPIWDWRKPRLLDELRRAKIMLPPDYRVFGRSFDGVDYRFLDPIRRTWPDDYARILQFFPLAEVEIKRREYARQIYAR